jgi:hypothetical protein
MVASEATSLACRSLKLDSIVTRAEKLPRMDNKPNLSREVKLQWAGSRERISTPVEAEFFLDIPFYRTQGLGRLRGTMAGFSAVLLK